MAAEQPAPADQDPAGLPGAERLFARFVAPFYDAESAEPMLLPDAFAEAYPPGTEVAEAQVLDAEGVAAVRSQLQEMLEAALEDSAELLPGNDSVTLELIDAIDRYWDAAHIAELLSEPAEDGGTYHVLCIEIAVLLGEALRSLVRECEWLPDWPYWESSIYYAPSGTKVNVFHWAVKKLSADGLDESLVLKLESCAAELRRSAK